MSGGGWRPIALLCLAMAASACASGGHQVPARSAGSTEPEPEPVPEPEPSSRAQVPSGDTATGTTIRITFGANTVGGVVSDSAAGRALIAQLPLHLTLSDHGGVEKTGPLPSALPIDDEPAGADPDVGAIGYYSPGNDLVLYYGDQSYFDGIVVLGRMTGDPERLADISGDAEVSVTLIEQ